VISLHQLSYSTPGDPDRWPGKPSGWSGMQPTTTR